MYVFIFNTLRLHDAIMKCVAETYLFLESVTLKRLRSLNIGKPDEAVTLYAGLAIRWYPHTDDIP